MKLAYLPVALLGLLLATSAYGQGVGTSGEITGTVADPTGALIAKAPVVAIETAKGIQHNTQTDESGHYRFSGLPPAVYSVTVESQGFAPETRKDVTVILGETTIINLQMHMANIASNVEVTADVDTGGPVVDVERASQASTLDQRYINGLPIDRRDYLSFSLLMPGVSESLTIADNRDLRAREVPQSGLSLYGSNGRGNTVTVDGGNFNGYSQFVMANVSQDAVQEFQINRANYSAVLGGANGASINIVTKSGTNTFHGSLYGFFRDDALDARDPFAFSQALTPGQAFSLTAQGQPVKNSLGRQQFGGTMGFPLKKDRTFMFVAYEGLLQNKQASVPLLTNSNIFGPQSGQQAIINGLTAQGGTPVPCLTGQPAMPASTCAGILQNILTINPAASSLNAFLVNQFETNGGLLPFPITSHQGSVRLDHQINDRNQTSLRYIVAHVEESDPSVQSLSGFSNGFSELQWTNSLQASWLHTFNASTLNEARIQWNINQYNLIPNTMGEPNLALAGFGNFGQNLTLPNISTERDYEFADNLDTIHGKHIFQMGINEMLRGNRTANFGFMGGEFSFGELPGGILSPCLQVPAACGVTSGPVTINAMQSFSLGLPQAYIQGFGNPTVTTQMPLTSVYLQDDWSLRSNFSLHLGVRYEIDQRAFIHTSYNNFAPRASFAWDPFKDHKTVVRGGYGIYYSPIILQVDTSSAQYGGQSNNRQVTSFVVPLNGLPGNPAANSAAIFQTLFTQGKISCGQPAAGNPGCITPTDLLPFGINVNNSGALPPFAITFNTAPDFRNPYSQQATLGIERELAPGLSIAANYIYVHSVHLARSTDVNVLSGAPVTANVPGTNGLPFQNWADPQCQVAINNPCFANPLLFSNNVFSSTADAVYQAGTLELKKRFSHHFTLLANYTYSKAMDDSPDFTYWSNNQVQTAAERALSSFDQRHRIVIAAVIDSPFRSPILKGFELAPIVEYRSPHPFNLYAGTDVNGDRTDFADRPPGAGRNTGIGPEYANTSLRLSRRFRINETASIHLTAEAFDLLNRTNYSRVNGEVGPAFAAPFNVHGNSQLLPNQPLGFTADFPKREIQLGARFSF
ncbi:MAG: TonB-dependent receptor [Acidobacteriia bacterium]|nr:TonB-dependent receptor [Terriglobia bacterium]